MRRSYIGSLIYIPRKPDVQSEERGGSHGVRLLLSRGDTVGRTHNLAIAATTHHIFLIVLREKA